MVIRPCALPNSLTSRKIQMAIDILSSRMYIIWKNDNPLLYMEAYLPHYLILFAPSSIPGIIWWHVEDKKSGWRIYLSKMNDESSYQILIRLSPLLIFDNKILSTIYFLNPWICSSNTYYTCCPLTNSN